MKFFTTLHLTIILLLSILSISVALESVLKGCCTMGVRWAWDNRTCNEYPTPIQQVGNEHQAPCLSTIDACCRRQYRERQCIRGQEAAKAGRECLPGVGTAAQYHQDCCEGCKLGLIAGAMNLQCEFQSLKLALGPPWDISLTRCCLQAGGIGRTSSQPVPVSRPPTQRPSTTGRHEVIQPQDFCALFPGQLCSQLCVTEGNSYRCKCRDGYVLLSDGKSCQESRGTDSPGPTGQSPSGPNRCPVGFVFNTHTQVCDDIDECLLAEGARSCFPYKRCLNTIGSFLCEEIQKENESSPGCPPGYRFKDDSATCIDIDECAEGYDICTRAIQYCINTPGGFDCQNKKEFTRYNCPAGYKFNNNTLNCEDVNECLERLDSCDKNTEVCRNTAGAYECDTQCLSGFRYDTRLRACQDIDECKEGIHDCRIDKERCVNVQGSYQCHQLQAETQHNCPPGYEPNRNYSFLCQDRDECATNLHTCAASETCVNEVGGYRCEVASNVIDEDDGTDSDWDSDETTTENSLDSLFDRKRDSSGPRNSNRTQNTDPRVNHIEKSSSCSNGFRVKPSRPGEAALCDDIDECAESNPCDSTQLCQNTLGSYFCHCKTGFYRDPITEACLDVNECQTGQHNCAASQRCDNSPGSFSCIRITGCGTGYTLNSGSGQCEDDDECLFGNHDCTRLGPEWQCRNIPGSFRCEKATRSCPAGLSLAPNGECRPSCSTGYIFNQRGECVDIDECKVLPGIRSACPTTQPSVFGHALVILLQGTTLSVAINANNRALLTVMMSNNFVELKGAVFKKFDKINLFQVSCSDVRERFHLCILLLVVCVQTMREYSWEESRFWVLFPDCVMVLIAEIGVDWLKHAFITRFNEIPSQVYREYTLSLAYDLAQTKQRRAFSDHSDMVGRRLGFVPLPLAIVLARVVRPSLRGPVFSTTILAILVYVALSSFRLLGSIILLGKACDLIDQHKKESTPQHVSSTQASTTFSQPSDQLKHVNNGHIDDLLSKFKASSSSQPTTRTPSPSRININFHHQPYDESSKILLGSEENSNSPFAINVDGLPPESSSRYSPKLSKRSFYQQAKVGKIKGEKKHYYRSFSASHTPRPSLVGIGADGGSLNLPSLGEAPGLPDATSTALLMANSAVSILSVSLNEEMLRAAVNDGSRLSNQPETLGDPSMSTCSLPVSGTGSRVPSTDSSNLTKGHSRKYSLGSNLETEFPTHTENTDDHGGMSQSSTITTARTDSDQNILLSNFNSGGGILQPTSSRENIRDIANEMRSRRSDDGDRIGQTGSTEEISTGDLDRTLIPNSDDLTVVLDDKENIVGASGGGTGNSEENSEKEGAKQQRKKKGLSWFLSHT